ncbi:cobalamin biosynthesis protein [Microvirga antarctica]|uniref:cobalamin biosynthesis protein n=1 Tax=Microvirga antarctica TaxID=2819233 RepID=UPI001B313BAD|nr:cobalamin biosynthesis protein [Microvirga antarctica]
MIVAGLGCRSLVSPQEVMDLVAAAAHAACVELSEIASLATIDTRSREPGLVDAATRLGLPILAVSGDAMRSSASRVATHSPRAIALFGVGSVAEAAALAAIGPAATLLLPRIASDRVTCALAMETPS